MALVATGTRDLRDCRHVSNHIFVVTDHTQDLALDCDTDNANAIADVLGNLIQALIEQGIIQGTVTDK